MYSDQIDYKKNNKPCDLIPENSESQKLSNNYVDYPKIIEIRESISIVLNTVDNVEGKVTYYPNYLSEEEAKDLYDHLVENLNWQQREGTNINGDKYKEPRKTCWFGKPYKYSAVTWDENKDWDTEIGKLRVRLSTEHPINETKEYNSVMCNYYRDNNDSIGWHADDETSLGRFPKIASISLGCERVFEVCKREEYYNRNNCRGPHNNAFNGCTILYKFHLNPGSLLIMEGAVQEGWLHRVPKEYKEMDGRINLTYRYIVDEVDENAEIERRKENRKRMRANKPSYRSENQSNNNSDKIDRVNYQRKTEESSREYYQNRKRSSNYQHKNQYRWEHYEGENQPNNKSSQYKNQKETQYTGKKSGKESTVSDEIANTDYRRFQTRK